MSIAPATFEEVVLTVLEHAHLRMDRLGYPPANRTIDGRIGDGDRPRSCIGTTDARERAFGVESQQKKNEDRVGVCTSPGPLDAEKERRNG